MYEYDLRNVHTGEQMFMWAYSERDLDRRMQEKKLNLSDWDILHCDYID